MKKIACTYGSLSTHDWRSWVWQHFWNWESLMTLHQGAQKLEVKMVISETWMHIDMIPTCWLFCFIQPVGQSSVCICRPAREPMLTETWKLCLSYPWTPSAVLGTHWIFLWSPRDSGRAAIQPRTRHARTSREQPWPPPCTTTRPPGRRAWRQWPRPRRRWPCGHLRARCCASAAAGGGWGGDGRGRRGRAASAAGQGHGLWRGPPCSLPSPWSGRSARTRLSSWIFLIPRIPVSVLGTLHQSSICFWACGLNSCNILVPNEGTTIFFFLWVVKSWFTRAIIIHQWRSYHLVLGPPAPMNLEDFNGQSL